ncbi:MAG: hemolysin family protein [Pyramidobacter sp.]
MEALPRLCTAILCLLLLSAFFSGAEMALTETSAVRLKALAEKYSFLKKTVEWVNVDRYKVLSAILIGNNLVNVAASTVSTAIAVTLWHARGVAYAVIVMTVAIIIFGEVLPKCLALARGESLLLFALLPIRLFAWLATPLIWTMQLFAAVAGKLTGLDLSLKDTFVTKEEIGQVVKIGEASGAIERTERQMIDGVISLDEIRVSEIMVPRTEMHLIESSRTVDEALRFIQEMGDSRVPVYTGTPDHIDGIVLVKDLLSAFSQGKKDEAVTKVMRKPLFVPETMYVPQLFKIMQTVRMHMALVVDEYGGTAGLVTMEDLLEEIVGEIQDEYDSDEPDIQALADGTYKVLSGISLEELNEALHSDFECDGVDTLGGLLLDRFGNFPRQGDSIALSGWIFTVTSMAEHHIVDVTVKKADKNAEGGRNE